MAEREVVLRAESLAYAYHDRDGAVRVFDGFDLSALRGRSIAVTGPSGSGKSTLLGLLGLLRTPSRGRIVLDGIDTARCQERQRAELRARTLGFVFQHSHLPPNRRVDDAVAMPATWRADLPGRPRRVLRERAAQLLEDVGLDGLARRRTDQLSGGQRHRVAIARALFGDPAVLLADEPTGALDAATGEQIAEVLFSRCRDRSTTLIVATHNAALATRCDERIDLGADTLQPPPADRC